MGLMGFIRLFPAFCPCLCRTEARHACRPLWGALLHNLAALPPSTALEILQLLQSRVLGAVPSLPAKLQAEPFGDTALSQVCRLLRAQGLGLLITTAVVLFHCIPVI